MAKPQQKVFEQLVVNDFIFGTISEIKYEKDHAFNSTTGTSKVADAVKIIFKLDGYSESHGTRWMTFSYDERANLFAKYVSKLVENPKPYMDFDLDLLKGMKIKTIWKQDGKWQNIDGIWPNQALIKVPISAHEPDAALEEVPPEDSELEAF